MTKPEQAGLQSQFQDNLDHVRLIRKDGTTVSVSILIWEATNEVIGPDSPLEPTPDAIGQPGVDPKQWREWSIVENHLKAQQRQALSKLLGRGEEG